MTQTRSIRGADKVTNPVVLYTPDVLALATSLAAWPMDAAMPLQATARSRACGSAVTLGLVLDEAGKIARLSMRVHACAIGQAAAAIFASGATGRGAQEIARANQQLDLWLAGDAGLPDWPGFGAIEAARAYPGRHGAIRLAWQAAGELLP